MTLDKFLSQAIQATDKQPLSLGRAIRLRMKIEAIVRWTDRK